jgi:hypothetical protein
MAREGNVKSKKTSLILNIVLVLILVGAGSWFFLKYRKERSDLGKKYADAASQLEAYKKDPNAAAQAEVTKTVDEVGKLYALPKDEQPSVATVKDKEKLKDQPFFDKAENGDVTLIYSTAKVAILYRPSTKQIINVSSVTIQDQQQTPTTP